MLRLFEKLFVSRGRIDRQCFGHLREAYRLNQIAVAGSKEQAQITSDMAASVLSVAQKFGDVVEEFLWNAG